MSGLFGGGKSTPSASPITSLRLQTSTRGRPIPLAYGKPRIQPNLIWYGDLVATPHEQSNGGKGGGGGSSTSYTYTAATIMALCEGAINAIPRVWRQKEVYTGTPAINQVKRVQDEAYAVPASLVLTVANAASYSANVAVAYDTSLYDMPVRTVLTEGVHYTRSGGTYTFSAGLRGLYVYITYDYVASISAPQDACAQLGLSVVPGTYAQTALGWMTTKHPTEALAYRGLAYVAASTYALSDNADLQNHSFEIDTQFGYSPTIRDANPKDVIADLLTNPHYGAGFPASKLGDSTIYSQFCVANNIFVSPSYLEQAAVRDMLSTLMTITNASVLYSEGQLKFVPFGDVAATANGVTFTPNTTPVYDLTDDDFLGDAGSDPIKVTRKPNSDAYNCVRIKFYNRANNYNEEIVEAKDQANIELFGLRAMDVMDVKELCDATAARSVAQLVLQRALYIRNQFEFRLGWSKALLEPMDLVTLTDSAMGMAQTPARILTIEEDEWGELTVTAEEFPLNVCNAATYNTQPPIGYAANFNAAPGNVTAPVIFEPPIELATSNDALDIWIAAGGGADYGGCEVWLSLDDATYKRVGEVQGNARYGTLTAPLASQPAPGIAAQTLSVSLVAGGQLLSGTLSDATLLNTLCYVGGEFMAYQTATLTGANAYDLATLNRGAYESQEWAHASGEDFVRIDDSLVKIALTKDYIGKTLYVKCLAFNQFGGGLQSLADVAAHTYVVTGRFVKLAPPDVGSLSVQVKADGTRQYTFDTSNAPKDVAFGGGYQIRYRLAGTSTPWGGMTPLHTGLITQSPYETNQPLPGVYDFAVVAVDSLGNSSLDAFMVSDVVMTDGDFTDAKTAIAVAADNMEGYIARINALISANKAETAQATADAATADITNIVSDSVLAKGEKGAVIQDYNAILGEQSGIDTQADSLSISRTTYDTAVSALTTYLASLSPAYNDTTTNTAIVAATFRQKFVDVYTAKQALLNAFAAKASTLATWTGIVGSSGTIGTGNVASIIDPLAIGTTQLADAAIATAKIATNAATEVLIGTLASRAATWGIGSPVVVLSYTNSGSVAADVVASITGAVNHAALTNYSTQGPIRVEALITFCAYTGANVYPNYDTSSAQGVYAQTFTTNDVTCYAFTEAKSSAPVGKRFEVRANIDVFGAGVSGPYDPVSGTQTSNTLKMEVIKK
jgi:hypothetical protein